MSKPEQTPETLEIRPGTMAVRLASLGISFCVIGGIALINNGKVFTGWLMILFFGGVGLYTLPKMLRRPISMVLTPQGLNYITFHGPHLIAWDTIEKIGITWRYMNRWVGIRLWNYDAYLANMPKGHARLLRWFVPIARLFHFGFRAHASLPASMITKLWSALEGSPDPGRAMKNLGKAGSLAGVLLWTRQTYGYDLVFAWSERDRSAGKFVNLLEQWRQKYQTQAKGS